MKRLLLLASCIALSACSTYGPNPSSSSRYDLALVPGYYGGYYSSFYPNSARLRGQVISPFDGYDPYYFGSGRTTAFGHSLHYYRNNALGHSSGITLAPGYDRLHRSSYFGGYRRSLGYDVRHKRGH